MADSTCCEREDAYVEIGSSVAKKETVELDDDEWYCTVNTSRATDQVSDSNKRPFKSIVLIAVTTVLAVIILIAFIVAFFEIIKLKNDVNSLEESLLVSKKTVPSLEKNISLLEESVSLQISTSSQLSERFDIFQQFINTSIALLHSSAANTNQLLGTLLTNLLSSSHQVTCSFILQLAPSSPSGYYWLRSLNGSDVHAYCEMSRSCGNTTGGWMRVAELDMTNSSSQCPNGLVQQIDSNIRTCTGTNPNRGSCSSVTFDTFDMPYSKVCGMVRGYQYGITDAFLLSGTRDINTHYVDGVSITHGAPRQHIWTFAAGRDKTDPSQLYNCPCSFSHRTKNNIPEFVGDDYFCDSGSEGETGFIFYGGDPLWDGAGCEAGNDTTTTCCSFNHPPWFYKELELSTVDDLEMRVCRDSIASNEDILIEKAEIYVQ